MVVEVTQSRRVAGPTTCSYHASFSASFLRSSLENAEDLAPEKNQWNCNNIELVTYRALEIRRIR